MSVQVKKRKKNGCLRCESPDLPFSCVFSGWQKENRYGKISL